MGRAGNPSLLAENISTPRPLTPEEIRAARLTVCARAESKEEAVMLLNMLGLLDD